MIRVFLPTILILLGFSCKNEDSNSKELCDCPLDLIYESIIYKDSTENNSEFNISTDLSINPKIRKILELEASVGLKVDYVNDENNKSILEKKSNNEISQDLIDAYITEREFFCARYKIICRDKSTSDSLKTILWSQELDKLTIELRKVRELKKDNEKAPEVKPIPQSNLKSNRTDNLKNNSQNKSISNSEGASIDKIEAPNALIVTKDQKGGVNTVIQPKVEAPLPKVKIEGWTVTNQKVNKIVDTVLQESIVLPNTQIKESYLYHNQVFISYYSEILRNSVRFLIIRDDIYVGQLYKIGMIKFGTGKVNNGQFFLYQIQQPENGKYRLDIFSKEKFRDPWSEIKILN